jgi:ParB-like nuclease domain
MTHVYPRADGRPVVAARLGLLVDSLRVLGLRQPITVRPRQRLRQGRPAETWEIVAGRHRYEAARALGWSEIDAVVIDAAADDAELWEIDENFARAELSDAQRADHHVRRERILVGKGLVRTNGGDRKSDAQVAKLNSYAEQAAGSLGVHRATVNRDLARGKAIAPAILAEVAGTALDKGVVLDELARTPRAAQAAKLKEISGRRAAVRPAETPAAAPVAAPPEVWICLSPRPDGGLRVWSRDLPQLTLSHADPRRVLADLPAVLEAELQRRAPSTLRVPLPLGGRIGEDRP